LIKRNNIKDSGPKIDTNQFTKGLELLILLTAADIRDKLKMDYLTVKVE